MVNPVDYTLKNIPDPAKAFMGGIQQGVDLQKLRAEKVLTQQAVTQNAQLNAALARLNTIKNPTAADYAAVANLAPKDRAATLMQSWDRLNAEQQGNRLKTAGEIMAALQSAPDIGVSMLQKESEAARNAGNEDMAKAYDTWAQLAQNNPDAVRKNMGILTAHLPGGDKVIDSVAGLGAAQRAEEQGPAQLTKAQAEAEKAKIDSQFAESNAVLELNKKNWDINKIISDIDLSKENQRIAAMNAAMRSERNQIERDKLQQQIEAAKLKRDEKIRAQAAEVESARLNIDNMLNTGTRLMAVPDGVWKAAAGPIDAVFPTMQKDVQDFEALLKTYGSQAFLAQLPNMKGYGALSGTEGETLKAAMQSFATEQSDTQLRANVEEAQRLLGKMRANVAVRYGVPDTVPDIQARGQFVAPPAVTAPGASAGGGVRVTLPDGQSVTFASQQQADAFRQAAGL